MKTREEPDDAFLVCTTSQKLGTLILAVEPQVSSPEPILSKFQANYSLDDLKKEGIAEPTSNFFQMV